MILVDRNVFVTEVQIEDGNYFGEWHGYVVEFKDTKDRVVSFRTSIGIRGWSKCRFTVVDGKPTEPEVTR